MWDCWSEIPTPVIVEKAVMPIGTAEKPYLTLAGTLFTFAGAIAPERMYDGTVRAYTPQGQYAKASSTTLHKHGAGPFCRFGLQDLLRSPAVYVITVDGAPKYVGETVNLVERFGPRGYGVIHPRNCYVGGQPTNCKINNKIYEAVQSGQTIDLYVHYSANHKAVEAGIRSAVRLPWNAV